MKAIRIEHGYQKEDILGLLSKDQRETANSLNDLFGMIYIEHVPEPKFWRRVRGYLTDLNPFFRILHPEGVRQDIWNGFTLDTDLHTKDRSELLFEISETPGIISKEIKKIWRYLKEFWLTEVVNRPRLVGMSERDQEDFLNEQYRSWIRSSGDYVAFRHWHPGRWTRKPLNEDHKSSIKGLEAGILVFENPGFYGSLRSFPALPAYPMFETRKAPIVKSTLELQLSFRDLNSEHGEWILKDYLREGASEMASNLLKDGVIRIRPKDSRRGTYEDLLRFDLVAMNIADFEDTDSMTAEQFIEVQTKK